MATTSNYPGAIDSLPAPPATLAGPPTHEDVHLQLADAIEKIETELGVNGGDRVMKAYASAAARNAAIPSPTAGNVCYRTDTDRIEFYDGAAWWNVARRARGVTLVEFVAGTSDPVLSFGVTFAAAPVVVATAQGSGTDLQIHITTRTTTTATLQCWKAGAAHTGSVNVHWIAEEI